MAALFVNYSLSVGGQKAISDSGRFPSVPGIPGATQLPAGATLMPPSAWTEYLSNPDAYLSIFKQVGL